MPSASCYTAKKQFIAENRVTKVEYPQHVAKNYDPLYSGVACNARYNQIQYLQIRCTKPIVCVK